MISRASFFLIPVLALSAAVPCRAGSDLELRLSGPISWSEGNAFLGAYVTVLADVGAGFQAGGETGYLGWSSGAMTVEASSSASEWQIPIYARTQYAIATGGAFHPYLGASLGLALMHTSVSSTVGAATASGTSTGMRFAMFAHLGGDFGDGARYFTDLRIGAVGSSLAVAPTIGFRF